MKKVLVGTYIGKDGSMEFKNGQQYSFTTCISDGYLKLSVENSYLYCFYSSLESLLDNWELSLYSDDDKLSPEEIVFWNDLNESNVWSDF